jgi:hypothetical protein
MIKRETKVGNLLPVQDIYATAFPPLPLSTKIRYWRRLICTSPDMPKSLMAGHMEEMRVALRDAVHELESIMLRQEKNRQGRTTRQTARKDPND